MCGRFTLTPAGLTLMEQVFGASLVGVLDGGTYNMKPTNQAPVMRADRRFAGARWGLIPAWAQDPSGPPHINARAETVAEKPTFKQAFRRRRCLVPADGFYEWSGTKVKQPWYFQMKDKGLFAFAGIWEEWTPPEGPPILTFALMTTAPNAVVAPIHDRMPVILPKEVHAAWLDPERRDPADVMPMLRPYDADAMTVVPVGPGVGQVGRDDAGLIEPVPRDVVQKLF